MTANVRRAMRGRWTVLVGGGSRLGRPTTQLRCTAAAQRRVVLLRRKWRALRSPRRGRGQAAVELAAVDARQTGTGAVTHEHRPAWARRPGPGERKRPTNKNQWGWGGHDAGGSAAGDGRAWHWWPTGGTCRAAPILTIIARRSPGSTDAIGRQTNTLAYRAHVAVAWQARLGAAGAHTHRRSSPSCVELRSSYPLDRWYRILSLALVKYLHGRQLEPPRRIHGTTATARVEKKE